MDLFNQLTRGVEINPEEFPKDAEGISIRLENKHGHERGYSKFEPHIFSDVSRTLYGENEEQTFYRMIDAMCEGESSFDCDDIFMYHMTIGRLATYFWPVSEKCIGNLNDYRENAVWKKGKGIIPYRIETNESTAAIQEFEQLVCDILDDCISDDYNDLEKAIAIYEYITENWVYDYELYEHNNDPEWANVGSVYRCLFEKTGICWEIAGMYQYLLLQCGISAEEATGFAADGTEAHAWNRVILDGKGYLVDPTWAITRDGKANFAYFCFTDKMREERDGYKFEDVMLAGTDEMSCKKNQIYSDDERYAPLWEGSYIGMDRSAGKIIYEDYLGVMRSFGYGAD